VEAKLKLKIKTEISKLLFTGEINQKQDEYRENDYNNFTGTLHGLNKKNASFFNGRLFFVESISFI